MLENIFEIHFSFGIILYFLPRETIFYIAWKIINVGFLFEEYELPHQSKFQTNLVIIL